MWWRNCNNMWSQFDRLPEHDAQTNRQNFYIKSLIKDKKHLYVFITGKDFSTKLSRFNKILYISTQFSFSLVVQFFWATRYIVIYPYSSLFLWNVAFVCEQSLRHLWLKSEMSDVDIGDRVTLMKWIIFMCSDSDVTTHL